MGIPTCRFMDQKQCEQFKCSICLDVADNPVLLKGCEHIFCQSCLEKCDNLVKCPSCQVPVSSVMRRPWKGISGFVKRWYLDMKMKCLNPVCDRVLDPSDYKNHDDSCSITFTNCGDCGYKTRRGEDLTHSCAKELKEDYKKKMVGLEDKMAKSIMQTRLAMAVALLVLVATMVITTRAFVDGYSNDNKELRSELTRNEEQLMTERIRYENLIASSLSFRGTFGYERNYDSQRLNLIVSRDKNLAPVQIIQILTAAIDDVMKNQKKPVQ